MNRLYLMIHNFIWFTYLCKRNLNIKLKIQQSVLIKLDKNSGFYTERNIKRILFR